jgi:hypothetical protein
VQTELRLVWDQVDPPLHFDLSPANQTNPFAGVGFTDENPAPMGTTVDSGGWRFRINEVVRGVDALARLESQSDSPFGVTVPEGAEYLLVQVNVEPMSPSANALRRYDSTLVSPDGSTVQAVSWPRFQPAFGYVSAESPPVDLWLVYEVPPESTWQLVIDRQQRRYLSLE